MLATILSMKNVVAANFTVADYNQVLYTNENTKLLNDADSNNVLVAKVDANLPVQVTGITSNGYFRVVIANQTLYIQGNGLSTTSSSSTSNSSITSTSQILYTNSKTKLYQSPNENSLLVPSTDANLPVQITGVTDNGYYQVVIANQTLYIPTDGLSGQTSANTKAIEDARVYNIIMAQKANFPDGMTWTNANYYQWKGGIYIGGYGCAAISFYLSDLAFGDAPARIHRDYSNIRVGDMLRIYNNTHSVTVIQVKENSVIVVEGNYNSKIKWGRELSMSEIIDSQSYILTRYAS